MPLQAFLVVNPRVQDIQPAFAGIQRSRQQALHRHGRRDHQKAAVPALGLPGLTLADAVLAALVLDEPVLARARVGWAVGFLVWVLRLGLPWALSPASEPDRLATIQQTMVMRLQPAKPVHG